MTPLLITTDGRCPVVSSERHLRSTVVKNLCFGLAPQHLLEEEYKILGQKITKLCYANSSLGVFLKRGNLLPLQL